MGRSVYRTDGVSEQRHQVGSTEAESVHHRRGLCPGSLRAHLWGKSHAIQRPERPSPFPLPTCPQNPTLYQSFYYVIILSINLCMYDLKADNA